MSIAGKIQWGRILDVLGSVSILVAALLLIWRLVAPRGAETAAEKPSDIQSFSGERAAIRGVETTNVVLVEFSDFECPFCRRFSLDTLPRILAEFVDSGKLRFMFRHYPLQRHKLARDAAQSAMCAERQGKFWEMHDLAFATQDPLTLLSLESHANRAGIAKDAWRACLAESGGPIEVDIEIAQSLHFDGTPGFVIGTMDKSDRVHIRQKFSGAKPFGFFESLLNDQLKAMSVVSR